MPEREKCFSILRTVSGACKPRREKVSDLMKHNRDDQISASNAEIWPEYDKMINALVFCWSHGRASDAI